MQLNNQKEESHLLWDYIRKHYESINRKVLFLGRGKIGSGRSEGDNFYVDFLIDRKYVIRYSLPTAPRTYAIAYIGVGPHFIPIDELLYLNIDPMFMGGYDLSFNGIKSNLKTLDRYLEKWENEKGSYPELENKIKKLEEEILELKKEKKTFFSFFRS